MRVEPVNVILEILALLQSSAPMEAASLEVMMLNTPAGIPARSAKTATAKADSGVNSAGRATKLQPAYRQHWQ